MEGWIGQVIIVGATTRWYIFWPLVLIIGGIIVYLYWRLESGKGETGDDKRFDKIRNNLPEPHYHPPHWHSPTYEATEEGEDTGQPVGH